MKLIYPKDVFKSKQCKTTDYQRAKFPIAFFIMSAIVVFFRVNLGLYVLGNFVLTTLLNIVTLIVWLNLSLSFFRTFVIEEKKKKRLYSGDFNQRQIKRYSNIELRQDENAYFTSGSNVIYMPEVTSLRTTFIKLEHLSFLDKKETEALLESVFNFCAKKNLVISQYTVPKELSSFTSLTYIDNAIKNNTEFTEEQLRRASLRLEYNRENCKFSAIVTDVFQITATPASNLRFPKLINELMIDMTTRKTSLSIHLMTYDEVESFVKNFFRLKFLDLNRLSERKASAVVKSSILLHTVETDNEEYLEFTPISIGYSRKTKVYNRESLPNRYYHKVSKEETNQ